MKKKEIVMICFVLLVTVISLFTILQYSGNNSNNSNIENNTSTSEQANSSKGPTLIDQNENTDNNAKTDDKKSNTNNVNTNEDDVRDDEDSSDTLSINETYTIYKVKKGDTLSSIAKNYEDVCPISVLSKAILKSNNLSKASEIKEGMEIKIPDKYTKGNIYTVKSGDSLYTIALSAFDNLNVYKAITQLKNDNFLTSETIKVGDKLFISSIIDSSLSVSSSEKTTEDESTTANTTPVSDKDLITYTLKDGETLSTITKRYEKYCPTSISSKIILELNGFTDAKSVKAGTEIKIPEKYLTNGEKYTIKLGDTLSAIASTYFTDMNLNDAITKIMTDNFMSSHNIKMGDQLYITALSLNLEEE